MDREKSPDNTNATPNIDLELSPVLTNTKHHRKKIYRKSRVKLMNRFSQSSTIGSPSPAKSDFSPQKHETTETKLEERLKQIKELQNKSKFIYEVFEEDNSDTIELTQKIEEKYGLTQDVSNKTECVLNQTKCVLNNFEIPKNLNLTDSALEATNGFQTANGKNIELSEKNLKRATKIFDDILDFEKVKNTVLCSKEPVASTSGHKEINKINNNLEKNLELSGQNMCENEFLNNSFEQLVDKDFTQKFINPINIPDKKNLSPNPVIKKVNFVDQKVGQISKSSQESQNSLKFSPDTPEEFDFKIPNLQKRTEPKISPENTQFSDTQLWRAVDAAECISDITFSQWSPNSHKSSSPEKNKSQKNSEPENSDISTQDMDDILINMTLKDGCLVKSEKNSEEFNSDVSPYLSNKNFLSNDHIDTGSDTQEPYFKGFESGEYFKIPELFKMVLEKTETKKFKNTPLDVLYYDVKEFVDQKYMFGLRRSKRLCSQKSYSQPRKKRPRSKNEYKIIDELDLTICDHNFGSHFEKCVVKSQKSPKGTIKEHNTQKKNILKNSRDYIIPKVESVGFSTVSENKISISDNSLKKAINIFNVIEEIDTPMKNKARETLVSSNIGTGSGKKYISEDNLKKASNIFKDIKEISMVEKLESFPINEKTPVSSNFGFSTASGKKISISEDSLKKARNIFNDIEEIEISMDEKTPVSSNFGFSTASGKKVSISEDSLKKARNIFNDIEEIEIPMDEKTPVSSNFGFSTASGKKVSISEDSLKKARNIFNDIEEIEVPMNEKTSVSTNLGFSTASGKKVSISEDSLKKARNIFNDIEEIETPVKKKARYDTPVSSNFGFSTASGKKVSISEDSLKKARNIFNDLEEIETPIKENTNEKPVSSSLGFSTASGKKVSISEDSLKKARNIFNDLEEIEIPMNEKTPVSTNFGFSTASGKKVSISEDSLKKARNIFNDIEEIENPTKEKNHCETHVSSNFGFATASGKKISISEDNLKKARNIFNDLEEIEIPLNENTPVSTNFGFSTASGKKVSISEDSVKKARNIFNDIEEIENPMTEKSRCETPVSSNFGFATASGKKVSISEDSLKKARNIFNDLEEIEIPMNEKTPVSTNFGFSTASGKKVSISEDNLKKVRNIFNDLEEIEIPMNDKTPVSTNFGFSTASGKKVSISEDNLKKVRNIFNDLEEIEIPMNDKTPVSTNFGFSTASGKKVSISEDNLKKARNIFNDLEEIEIPMNEKTPVSTNFGFSTASGKKVSISEDNLKKARNIFNDIEEIEKPTKEKQRCETPVSSNFGFSTASGKKVFICEESLKKSRNIFEDITNETNTEETVSKIDAVKTPLNTSSIFSEKKTSDILKRAKSLETYELTTQTPNKNILKPSEYKSPVLGGQNETPLRKLGTSKKRSLGVSSYRQFEVSENSLKKAKFIFEDLDIGQCSYTPEKMHTPKMEPRILTTTMESGVKRITNLDTPKMDSKTVTTPACGTKNVLQLGTTKLDSRIITPEQKSYSDKIKLEIDTSLSRKQDLEQITDKNQKISYISLKEETKGNFDDWKNDFEKESTKLRLHLSVLETRMRVLEQQKKIMETTDKEHRRQRPGHLFIKKQNKKARIPLKRIVNNLRPGFNTKNKILCQKLSTNLLEITAENASKLHFYLPFQNEENKIFPAIITTEDSAQIIPNTQNFVGLTEIENSFKTMPAVDPNLIPKNWVQNHYKWIVWKLASMERSYPDYFPNYLNPENVVSQLKYRYDREIDHAQRSALKKILEADDTPAKRMVLCVSDIFRLEGGKIELELSDGWYSVRTSIDNALSAMVEKKIIKIGTKLMIQGAELINHQPCCPLEVPSTVRLQIFYNSTRRAAWYVKLGYQPNQNPIEISLRSIHSLGGNVGITRCYIARIYPMSHMEKMETGTIWRNEKAERKKCDDWESKRDLLIERLQQEVEEEMRQNGGRKQRRSVKKKDLEGVYCPKTLYEFLENSPDPESLKEFFTPSQCLAVETYQNQMASQKLLEMKSKLEDKLSKHSGKRKVSPVLRLLLVDIQSIFHYRTLSIWYPKECHLTEIKEGTVVKFYNILPRGNTLCSSSKMRIEKDNFDLERFDQIIRCVTPIYKIFETKFRPLFNEYDTVGLVVYLDIQNNFQNIWLVDENKRFLSIKIREGSNSCCLFDGIKIGKIVAVSNLIHRKSIEIGDALANHSTIFTMNPSKNHLKNYLNVFKKDLPKDLQNYVQECKDEVEALVAKNVKARKFTPFSFENTKNDEMTLSDEEMCLIDTSIIK